MFISCLQAFGAQENVGRGLRKVSEVLLVRVLSERIWGQPFGKLKVAR